MLDSHTGWHMVLESVYRMTGCSVDNLVVFSIVALFIFFCIVPLFFLKRPEAWPLALLVIITANFALLTRLMIGRPLIFTMAVVMTLGFMWPRFKARAVPWASAAVLTVLIAFATWIHCLWYMFALPVVCFFLAREWRAGFVVALCTLAGVVLGMVMTGHPILFFYQTLEHFFRSLGDHTYIGQLVTEFQPFNGDAMMVIVILGMLTWCKLRGLWDVKIVDNPVFILIAVSWVLGFVVRRVWFDWGMPALCVWMALIFEDYLEEKMDALSMKRVGLMLAIACVLFLAVTNDVAARWSQSRFRQYLSAEKAEHKAWLPEKGGVLYSDDMTVFYQTFYMNPHGNWRYILGFEASMMPAEDFATLRKIQLNNAIDQSYEPWVKKMRPEDRLVVRRMSKPAIKELEWYSPISALWVGRLPRTS
jgi:hypothetical protein